MTRRGLTLLLALAAVTGAGAVSAGAWFSTGSNATIAVTAYAPLDIRGAISARSQGTAGNTLTQYASQYVNGSGTATPAATGTDDSLAVQLGRHTPKSNGSDPWPDRLRVLTIHLGTTLATVPGGLRIKVETLDGTIPTGATSRTLGAGGKLTARISKLSTALNPAPVASTTAGPLTAAAGDRFEINLLPTTLSGDENTLWNATLRVTVEPVTAGSSTTYTRDVQILWCNKPGSTANCA